MSIRSILSSLLLSALPSVLSAASLDESGGDFPTFLSSPSAPVLGGLSVGSHDVTGSIFGECEITGCFSFGVDDPADAFLFSLAPGTELVSVFVNTDGGWVDTGSGVPTNPPRWGANVFAKVGSPFWNIGGASGDMGYPDDVDFGSSILGENLYGFWIFATGNWDWGSDTGTYSMGYQVTIEVGRAPAVPLPAAAPLALTGMAALGGLAALGRRKGKPSI